jgi:hypothetical protein
VLLQSIDHRFIANLAYRKNSRLSRYPPIKNTLLYCQIQLPPSATGFQPESTTRFKEITNWAKIGFF